MADISSVDGILKSFPPDIVHRAVRDGVALGTMALIGRELWRIFAVKAGHPAWYRREANKLLKSREQKVAALAAARGRNKALRTQMSLMAQRAGRPAPPLTQPQAPAITPPPASGSASHLAGQVGQGGSAQPTGTATPVPTGAAQAGGAALPSLPPLPPLPRAT